MSASLMLWSTRSEVCLTVGMALPAPSSITASLAEDLASPFEPPGKPLLLRVSAMTEP
jgi:hypothetical protein